MCENGFDGRDWRIEADVLVPGQGDPVREATLLVQAGRIRYAGPRAGAPASDGELVHAPVVMPGLWDCHGHLMGLSLAVGMNGSKMASEPIAARAARCVSDLRAALAAGVTSVREVGGLGVYLAEATGDGSILGPAVYAAGAVLSATGGHADMHDLPLDWVCDAACRGALPSRLCDGEDECTRAVREQLRAGAHVIKMCASGGVLSIRDDPRHRQFTRHEMHTIVDIAAMAERSVAAHAHGKPGIMAAIEAGVRTIEHGTYLDDESCDAMRETGTVLVPTRSIIEFGLTLPNLPPSARTKMEAVVDQHAQAVATAHQRGVTIAAGTDIALSAAGHPGTWGTNAREAVYLAELGLSPLEAIEAATATAPLTLGPQAPQSGILRTDYDADFLTLERSPADDIAALTDPTLVTGVWKNGQRVKDEHGLIDGVLAANHK